MCDINYKLKLSFEESEHCDVILKLESGAELKCHSLVLKLSSEFFASKLKKEWSGEDNVKCIDCLHHEDDTVVQMVKFMYGIALKLTEDNIQSFLACSVYYGVKDLTERCDNFLLSNLNVQNVIKCLIVSSSFGRELVIKGCYEYLDDYFEEAVSSNDDFFTLPSHILMSIAKRPSLSVSEEFLFLKLSEYCDSVIHNTEAFWTECLTCINYKSMSLDFFISQCVRRNVMSAVQQSQFLLYLSSVSDVDLNNMCLLQRNIECKSDMTVLRFVDASDLPSWKTDSLNGDRLKFKCDRSIKLKAVSVFGIPRQSMLVCLSLFLTSGNICVSEINQRIDFADNVHSLLRLKTKVKIVAEEEYLLVIRIKDISTYFGVSGSAEHRLILSDGTFATLTFMTDDMGTSSIAEGQIKELLLCE